MKKIKILLLAVMMVFAFSIIVEASPDAFDAIRLQNGTTIGGSDTGATGTLRVAPVVTGPKNFSIRGVYFNTTATSWSRATLAGISGNSSCTANKCNHTTTIRGAMGVTFTLPADVTRTHLRVEQNSTATGYANESVVLRIDSAVPIFAYVSPTPSNYAEEADGLYFINVTTGENVTSCTLNEQPNGATFTMTRSVSQQACWYEFTTAQQQYNFRYTVTANDYAVDGANSGTSDSRYVTVPTSGPSKKDVVVTVEGKKVNKSLVALGVFVIVVVAAVVAILAGNSVKKRRR